MLLSNWQEKDRRRRPHADNSNLMFPVANPVRFVDLLLQVSINYFLVNLETHLRFELLGTCFRCLSCAETDEWRLNFQGDENLV